MGKNYKFELCKYAQNKSNGCRCIVECSITKKICGMIKWCPVNNCPKMGDKFKRDGCAVAIKEDYKHNKQ